MSSHITKVIYDANIIMKKIISIILVLLVILLSIFVSFSVSAADAVSISYNFKNNDQFSAQGSISLKVNSSSNYGTYELYWADDNKQLSGYTSIASINLNSMSAKTYTMQEHTYIPDGATRLIAIKSSSVCGSYTLPSGKKNTSSKDDVLYSFMQLSDIHMDAGDNYYKYDSTNYKQALNLAQEYGCSFVVTNGDQITANKTNYIPDWDRYTKSLSDSNFLGPVYEGMGNHEIRYSAIKGGQDFIKYTGLGSDSEALSSSHGYYEVTEGSGDHFLFMSLENGFYAERCDNFTDEQLDWLESKLSKYQDDGHNIFIIEHVLWDDWGAGDVKPNHIYGSPLVDSFRTSLRLKNLLKKYKENVFFSSGHTHIKFEEQDNYPGKTTQEYQNFTNENGTSCYLVHTPSCACIKRISDDQKSLISDMVRENTQSYIIDVYKNRVVFKGYNNYYKHCMPSAIYYANTKGKIEPTTELTTEPTMEPTTEPTTESIVKTIYGDADENSKVEVLDSTRIQQHLANIAKLSKQGELNAKVEDGKNLTVKDATLIQQFLAHIIDVFPVEKQLVKIGATNYSKAQLDTLITNGIDDLKTNYLLSSFVGFTNLKKACYENKDKTSSMNQNQINNTYAQIDSLKKTFDKLVIDWKNYTPPTPSGKKITVKFSNTQKWSGTIYAYIWGTGSTPAQWPGTKMTSLGKDSKGNDLYSFDVDTSDYQNIIFTNGNGTQTVDINLPNSDVWYYVSGGSGTSCQVSTY